MQALSEDEIQKLQPLLSLIESDIKDFQDLGRRLGKQYNCQKLGEGSYADVFYLEPKDEKEARDLEENGGLVIKVIPFTVDTSEEFALQDLNAITREIRVLQTLDELHGFSRCRGIHIASGKYPDIFLEAFDAFKYSCPDDALNSHPSIYLSDCQLYAILEMDDAGVQIDNLKKPSAFQAFDIFWKTAMILARAESEFEFEHRDLHGGNVCYKPMKLGGPEDATLEVIGDMDQRPETILGLANLQVTIIDYTLSRAKVRNVGAEQALIIFDPIEYWETSTAEGSKEEEVLQIETYRKVRDSAKTAEEEAKAAAESEGVEYHAKDKYERFLPKSNVMWLECMLGILLLRAADHTGRGAFLPGSSRAAKKLQVEIWETLEGVAAFLNEASPDSLPNSAEDFLAIAVARKWLSQADLDAFEDQLQD